jgi:hypothetical protein
MYHMENPIASMRKIAAMTRKVMLVDTNIIPSRAQRAMFTLSLKDAHNPEAESLREAGMMWRTAPVAQLKPNRYAVEEILRFLGFSSVTMIEPKPTAHRRYAEGLSASFLAVR